MHGVGDGADWIRTQFHEQFGAQGTYLLDLWHVSEYLAGAATVIQPKKAEQWRHRQQGRLLETRAAKFSERWPLMWNLKTRKKHLCGQPIAI